MKRILSRPTALLGLLPVLMLCLAPLHARAAGAAAADVANGLPGARDWDDKMSAARRKLDWEEMFALAMDGEKARTYFESKPPQDRHSCSMCGKMCAMRTTNRILEGLEVKFAEEEK